MIDLSRTFVRTAALAVLALAVYVVLRSDTPGPIAFDDAEYSFFEATEVNHVHNRFFTPGGEAPNAVDRYLQASDYTHEDLDERRARLVERQILSQFDLAPLAGSDSYHFGMFRGRHPIYGLRRHRVFWLYVVRSGLSETEEQLRSGAPELLGRLDAALPAQ